MAQISVTLTADIKRLESALKDVRKDLTNTGNVAESSAKKISQTGTAAARGVSRLGKSTANAVPTLQEFSRVIQDAPFGIQGVGNNITQLVSSFGNLSKASGGAVGAFRLLISSLAGPAGVLFAVSTVVSLLTVFGDRLSFTKDKAKELNKELDKINDRYGAAVSLAESELKLLELQGKETTAKKQQLIGIIGAQAASLQAIQNQNEALLTQIKLQNEVVSDWELITQSVSRLAAIGVIGLTGAYEASKKVLETIRKPLEDLLNIEIDRSGFSAATAEDKQKELDLTAQVQQGQANINNLLAKALGLNQEITKEREKQNRSIQQRVDVTTAGVAPVGAGIEGQIIPGDLPGKIAAPLNQIQLLWAQTATNIRDIGQNSLVQGIQSTFAGVGRAIADGANIFAAFGAGIIGAFGNFLSQFGQQLISYGVAALAFSNVSKGLLNPITAGPSAIAAIAIGAALSTAGAALSSIGSRGLGGNSGGSGNFTAGGGTFTGASSSVSTSGGFGGTVVFEIQGTKLVGVLNRTLKKDRRSVADII